MTTSEEGPSRPSNTPKKRFIGKAKAEALRKKASEQSGVNIEDGVLTPRGICYSTLSDLFLWLGTTPRGGRVVNQIPADILEDSALNEAIKIVSFFLYSVNVAASTEL